MLGWLISGYVEAGGDNSKDVSKRELVAPCNNDAGEGLVPSVGQAVDGLFVERGEAVSRAVKAGGDSYSE
jgi:hypothetical protein